MWKAQGDCSLYPEGELPRSGEWSTKVQPFLVRREQRPIGKCTRLLISLKVISEIMCGQVTVDVVSSV